MPQFRARDGEKLHFRALGNGPACLLLHGFAMNSTHWLPFVAPLATRYRFILPDLRGFGRSHRAPFNQKCILSNYVEDVEDLLNHLDMDRVALGGISMGAFTSLQYHRLNGFERISSYLHIDQAPSAMNGDDWKYGLFGDAQEVRIGEFQAVLDAVDQLNPMTPYKALPDQVRRELRAAFAEFAASGFANPRIKTFIRRALQVESVARRAMPTDNWYAYIQIIRAYMEQDYDMRPHLSSIQVPVTLMVGMRSEMYPPAGQLHIRDLIPHARVMPFARAGHAIPMEQPLAFAQGLRQFLTA